MPRTNLGSTLVIANPTSHSGKGAAAAETVRRFFETYAGATTGFRLMLTKEPGDAVRLAADASEYDTVIALGGDGVIHEVVNGLMQVDSSERPRLGIIPMGSGNDFARTLGMTLNNPDAALHELLTGVERTIDLGKVTSDTCPEETYFMETLSFGLDAAIAVDTTTRRAKGTRQQGSGLFLTSSLKMFVRARRPYACIVRLDGGEEQKLKTLILAVQNGPTYGGGFRICPAAVPSDGRLDVCYNVRQPWVPHVLLLLGLARFGRHTGSAALRFERIGRIEADYSSAHETCPCQVDGEELAGTCFAAEVVPQALRVIAPTSCRW